MIQEKTTPAIELINVSRRFLSPTGKSLTSGNVAALYDSSNHLSDATSTNTKAS